MTLARIEQASIDLKIILRKEKMGIRKQLTQRIEKEVSAWEQWAFTAISKVKTYRLKVCSQVHLTTERLAHIKSKALSASKELAEGRGEAPDMVGSGLRNANLLAVAPNASSSIICNGTSPSIEPTRANVYTHKTLTGSYRVQNKYLERLLESKKKNTDKVWKDIAAYEGSVQHLDFLTEEEKETFKTAPEINQIMDNRTRSPQTEVHLSKSKR